MGFVLYLINWSAFRANNILPQADNHMVRKQSIVNRFQHKKKLCLVGFVTVKAS